MSWTYHDTSEVTSPYFPIISKLSVVKGILCRYELLSFGKHILPLPYGPGDSYKLSFTIK